MISMVFFSEIPSVGWIDANIAVLMQGVSQSQIGVLGRE